MNDQTAGRNVVTSRPRTPDPVLVRGPEGDRFTVTVQPSGVIGWQYDVGAHLVDVAVVLAGVAWNVLGRLVFRFGWSVVVYDEPSGRRIGRRRFRSKQAAVEALPGLAAELRDSGKRCPSTTDNAGPH
ncbi:hypothetical protein [Pedococcus bigeumensis]|uniref:hypothetical protein n=1 Tax=Pedococcus bigeumensis TaxID=433644 RepID=UPI002FE8A846